MAVRTISTIMSLLVVSGKGHRCNDFRAQLRNTLLVKDVESGLSKTYIHKYGKDSHPESFKEISFEVGSMLPVLLRDVSETLPEMN